MRQAAKRAAAERERVRKLDEERRRALLANMQGVIGNSDLRLNRVETQELRLRTTNEMFGTAANPTGTTTQETLVAGGVALPPAPPDVAGRPVFADTTIQITAEWDAYLEALQRRNMALSRLESAEQAQRASKQVRAEAERKVAEARVAPVPDESQVNNAAQMVSFAIEFDEKATLELDAANVEASAAEKAVAAAKPGSPGSQERTAEPVP
jgi:type IV secretory pathway VirB10-like protein